MEQIFWEYSPNLTDARNGVISETLKKTQAQLINSIGIYTILILRQYELKRTRLLVLQHEPEQACTSRFLLKLRGSHYLNAFPCLVTVSPCSAQPGRYLLAATEH